MVGEDIIEDLKKFWCIKVGSNISKPIGQFQGINFKTAIEAVYFKKIKTKFMKSNSHKPSPTAKDPVVKGAKTPDNIANVENNSFDHGYIGGNF